MNRKPWGIGIMQGRLSPPNLRRLQAFPWDTWEQEFDRAASCSLDGIEWLFEAERFRENPLFTVDGRASINELVKQSGTSVLSVCADYFMEYPLFRGSEADQASSREVLFTLIRAAAAVGARAILMPVLECAAIETAEEAARLADALRSCTPLLDECNVSIGLETELAAGDYLKLVRRCGHSRLGAYYDVGNAGAKGYDVVDDVKRLGSVLIGIHVKDRPIGGRNVPLGEGAVPFDDFFEAVVSTGYTGRLILQTAFGEDFLDYARRHRAFVQSALDRASV